MNFNVIEQNRLWKNLEDRAFQSDPIDFNEPSENCPFIDTRCYSFEVLKRLKFTYKEVELMLKLKVPLEFMPVNDQGILLVMP